MAQRVDNRGQWTIKHADLGPEFQTRVRKAAERQGMTVGAFVVETLRERATAILKKEGEDGTPQSTPPARLEDVADVLSQRLEQAMAAAAERLAREQAHAFAKIEEQARRGRWRR